MGSECATIKHLRKVAAMGAQEDAGIGSGAAASALKIISDINEYWMTAIDVECLHSLVDALVQHGQSALLQHLRAGSPDCPICEALTAKMGHGRRS